MLGLRISMIGDKKLSFVTLLLLCCCSQTKILQKKYVNTNYSLSETSVMFDLQDKLILHFSNSAFFVEEVNLFKFKNLAILKGDTVDYTLIMDDGMSNIESFNSGKTENSLVPIDIVRVEGNIKRGFLKKEVAGRSFKYENIKEGTSLTAFFERDNIIIFQYLKGENSNFSIFEYYNIDVEGISMIHLFNKTLSYNIFFKRKKNGVLQFESYPRAGDVYKYSLEESVSEDSVDFTGIWFSQDDSQQKVVIEEDILQNNDIQKRYILSSKDSSGYFSEDYLRFTNNISVAKLVKMKSGEYYFRIIEFDDECIVINQDNQSKTRFCR